MNKNCEKKWLQYQQPHRGQGHSVFFPLHMDILTLPLRCYDRAVPLTVSVQCLQIETFSPYCLPWRRKGFTFSSHSHGKWQLGHTGVSGHKNWTDLLCSWNEDTGPRGSCPCFLKASSDKNEESYRTTRPCITRSTEEESKRKCHFLMLKKLRSGAQLYMPTETIPPTAASRTMQKNQAIFTSWENEKLH